MLRSCGTSFNGGPRFRTLAAAYAETLHFEQAVRKQTEAIGLVADENERARFRARLELNQQKKPYRQVSQKRSDGELVTDGLVPAQDPNRAFGR
jgi:hypothetical protein